MKLLIDMDIIAYHAVFSADGDTVSGVVDKIDSIMEKILSATEVPCEYQGYLTGKGNFRHEISDVYKAQRPKEKPILLNFARNYLVEEWDAIIIEGQEADDAIAIEAARIGYDEAIIVSIDKDFKQLPCLIYNYQKDTWHKIGEWEATLNFYLQVLTGDRADNIKGVDGIGPVKAMKLLSGCFDEKSLYKACLVAYDNKADEVLKSARLLWLRREEGQMWEPPFLGDTVQA